MGCIALVSDFYSAEHGHAADHQCLHGSRIVHLRMPRVVPVPSKDAQTAHDYVPVVRNHDFSAAENGVDFDGSLVPLHAGSRQVDFESTEDCHELASLEIRPAKPPLASTEDSQLVEMRLRTVGSRKPFLPRALFAGFEGSNQHGEPYAYQDQRPEYTPQVGVQDIEFTQLQERAGEDQQETPHPPAPHVRLKQFKQAIHHQHRGPEAQQISGFENAGAVEQ